MSATDLLIETGLLDQADAGRVIDAGGERNCPFYGRVLIALPPGGYLPFRLLPQHGNQCALITSSFSPCQREQALEAVDWRTCEIADRLRINWPIEAKP